MGYAMMQNSQRVSEPRSTFAMSAAAFELEQSDYTRELQQTHHLLQTSDDGDDIASSYLESSEMQALRQAVANLFSASTLPAFLGQGLVQLRDRVLEREKAAVNLRT